MARSVERITNDIDSIGRRRFLKVTGGGALTASVAGCTGGGDGEDEPTTEEPMDGTTSTDDGSSGDGGDGGDGPEGGEFGIIDSYATQSLDPTFGIDIPSTVPKVNLYDPLIFTDPADKSPIPWLATDWDADENGTRWTFTLRDDVTFHTGNTLSAEDVVYSLDRTMGLGLATSAIWDGTYEEGNSEAVDETTVAIDLEEPFGPFIPTLLNLFVVDSTTVKENEVDGDYGNEFLQNNEVGSGPYVLEDWSQGSELTATAFEDYWGGWERNQFDSIRREIISESSTVATLLQQGDGDLTTGQPFPDDVWQNIESSDGAEIVSYALQYFHIPINTRIEPTDDVNVRRAISYAFDYETAINNIFNPAQPLKGPVPPTVFGANEELPTPAQDMDAARQALDEADYTVDEINEIGLEYVFIPDLEVERQAGLLLQQALGELGIDLQINGQRWSTITDRATSVETTPHLSAIYNSGVYNSPDSYVYLMYHPSSQGRYYSMSRYTPDELTELLEDARRTTDQEERVAKYDQAQQMVVDAHPALWVALPQTRIAKGVRVDGWNSYGAVAYDANAYHLTNNDA